MSIKIGVLACILGFAGVSQSQNMVNLKNYISKSVEHIENRIINEEFESDFSTEGMIHVPVSFIVDTLFYGKKGGKENAEVFLEKIVKQANMYIVSGSPYIVPVMKYEGIMSDAAFCSKQEDFLNVDYAFEELGENKDYENMAIFITPNFLFTFNKMFTSVVNGVYYSGSKFMALSDYYSKESSYLLLARTLAHEFLHSQGAKHDDSEPNIMSSTPSESWNILCSTRKEIEDTIMKNSVPEFLKTK